MRFLLLTGFCLLMGITNFAQQNTAAVSLYASVSNSGNTIQNKGLVGIFKQTSGGNHFVAGVQYQKPLNKWLSMYGGLEYANHHITTVVTQSTPPFTVNDPVTGQIRLLSAPIGLRVDVLKHFYFTVGTLVDWDMKNTVTHNQSGLGVSGGAGFQYGITKKISAFVNPFYQYHGVIYFSKRYAPERLYNAGLRMGVNLHI